MEGPKMKTIVKIVHGSRLYGTNTPSSDEDYKAIYLPEARDILLGRVKRSFHYNSKQQREKAVNGIMPKNISEDIDMEVLTLVHFFNMLEEGDPLVLDMLFVDGKSILVNSSIWEEIQQNKNRLICTKISRSLGYCYSQAAKYGIKGSRMAECRDLRTFFETESDKKSTAKVRDFDILIREKIANWQKTSIIPIVQGDGSTINHLECCSKKISYNVTVKEAFAILDNMFQKFGERTRQAENNQGVDWKGLSHAVRVGSQVLELLSTGNITFPRPDASKLLDIKLGKLPYKEVAAIIEDNVGLAEAYVLKSSLNSSIDKNWIDDFVYDKYRQVVMEE
jgi:hypothetical protein